MPSRPAAPSGPGGIISAERALEPETPRLEKLQPEKTQPNSNVIDFPEPKGRRKRRILLWVAAAVAAFVVAVVAGAVYSPVLAVQTITVDGTKLLTPAAVQKALAAVEGKPLPQLSEQEVTELLKPLVQVRSVSIEARPPSELLVHVVERVPVALAKLGESYVMVDVDGIHLGVTKDPAEVPLPLIDAGAGTTNTELFKVITAVLNTLPADVLARLSAASAKSVDAVELRLNDGKTVVWGNAEDKELKAKALEALLKMPPNPKVPINVYDVSTPRHPFTK